MAESLAPARIRVEMIADLTCPWCYIGKRKLEAAIAAYPGIDADWHWRAYQADPTIPADGWDLSTYRWAPRVKEEAQANQAEATQAGRSVGLNFAWDKIARLPNTRDAHRLIRFAVLYGAQTKLVERLFKAYFCEGADIGARSCLIDLAEDCGIDSYAVFHLFAGEDDIAAIDEEIAISRRLALPKLPCFIFADEIVVPGDASAELFAAALFRAQEAQSGSRASEA